MKKLILCLSIVCLSITAFAQIPQHKSGTLTVGGALTTMTTLKDTIHYNDSLQFVFNTLTGFDCYPVVFFTKTVWAGVDTSMDVTISESFDGTTWLRLMYVDSLKEAKILPTKHLATGTLATIRYNGLAESWAFGARYLKITFKPRAPIGYKAKIEGKFWLKAK